MKSDPPQIVSYETNGGLDQPRTPPEGASPDDARVSWLDIATAADNERGRHVIWRDELRARLKGDDVTGVERATLIGAIRAHSREVAVFEAMSRLIDRVRSDSSILARLRAIDAEERRTVDVADENLGNDQ